MSLMDEWLESVTFDEQPDGIPPLEPEDDDEDEDDGEDEKRLPLPPGSDAATELGPSEANVKRGRGSLAFDLANVKRGRQSETERDALRAVAASRLEGFERRLVAAYRVMIDDQEALAIGRLRGRKARQGTRHWRDVEKNSSPVEVKAVDPDYVLPDDRLFAMIMEANEGIVLDIGLDAAKDTARRLDADLEIGPDSPYVQQAVADAVAQMLAVGDAVAQDIRQVILDEDATGAELEQIIDAVEGTYAQRKVWAATAARTHANGLVNSAAVGSAIAAGVLTMQWLCTKDAEGDPDDRVRPTHVAADGQTRQPGEPFLVGGFHLRHPADLTALPEAAGEVYNCRCSLLFEKPERTGNTAMTFSEAP